mmetsp:Transcript_10891/g.27728  ORF Transcript_10891/g.27728 Transcript_10891/m.27728 type:complete len:287 (-) Transcript_10891:239-1099(-)
MVDFVVAAMPRATNSIRAKCGSKPVEEIRRHVEEMFDGFNKFRGVDDPLAPIDLDAFADYIIHYTACSKLLIQDELRRQLDTSGVKCVKLPSKHGSTRPHVQIAGPPRPHVFGAHQTLLTLHGNHLRYTNRRGARVALDPATLINLTPGKADHLLNVLYVDANETKTLVFSVSAALRGPLLELLHQFLQPVIDFNKQQREERKANKSAAGSVDVAGRHRRRSLKALPTSEFASPTATAGPTPTDLPAPTAAKAVLLSSPQQTRPSPPTATPSPGATTGDEFAMLSG